MGNGAEQGTDDPEQNVGGEHDVDAADEFEKAGKIATPSSAVALIRVNFGLATFSEGPRRDTSTPDGLKRAVAGYQKRDKLAEMLLSGKHASLEYLKDRISISVPVSAPNKVKEPRLRGKAGFLFEASLTGLPRKCRQSRPGFM